MFHIQNHKPFVQLERKYSQEEQQKAREKFAKDLGPYLAFAETQLKSTRLNLAALWSNLYA